MSLTVTPPVYSRNMIFNRRTIEKKIASAFPHWKLDCIAQARKQGAGEMWQEIEGTEANPDNIKKLIDRGFEHFNFLLLHENGVGEARPDYWAWELGEAFVWKVGDYTEVHVNQGWRPASIIAVLGKEALLEYEMPAGTTALWVIGLDDKLASCIRNVSYRACPKKWLKAIEESGVPWTGKGQ